jgi:hypothetical protein
MFCVQVLPLVVAPAAAEQGGGGDSSSGSGSGRPVPPPGGPGLPTWRDLSALQRAAAGVRKRLLLLHVALPAVVGDGDCRCPPTHGAVLDGATVDEVLFSHWVPSSSMAG